MVFLSLDLNLKINVLVGKKKRYQRLQHSKNHKRSEIQKKPAKLIPEKTLKKRKKKIN